MINTPQYIKIDDIIKILDKAVDQKMITGKAADEIIHRIYENADAGKYKRP